MPRTVARSLAIAAALLVAPSALAQQGPQPYDDPPPWSPPVAPPAPQASPEPPAEPPTATPTPPASDAEEPREAWPRFGEAGQVVLTGSTGLSFGSLRYSASDASRDAFAWGLGLHVFVVRGLSLGVDFEGSYSDTNGYGADSSLVETKATLVSGGPRLGLNLPLGERLSFYPRAILGVHWAHQEIGVVTGKSSSIAASTTASPSSSRVGPWLELYAPLDLQLAPGFFMGAGPRVYHDLARTQDGPDVGAERTEVSFQVEVGGFWGGPPAERAAAASASSAGDAPSKARFGDAGTLVLTNDFALGGTLTSYAGTDASSTYVTISPGIDFFPNGRFSFGGALGYTGSSQTGFEPDGTRVETSVTSFSVVPRVGVDLPLASWLSLYPRLSLGVGATTYDSTAAGKESKYTSTATFVSLSAPLLVHVVPHFFVGFGPYVTRDLTQSYDRSPEQNFATRVGASALVGGWL